MTFYPSQGLFGIDYFNDASGTSGTNTGLQSVINGYVSLLPQVERSVSYFNNWAAISGWTISNGLTTRKVVESTFYVTGGYTNTSFYTGISGYQWLSHVGGGWEIYTPTASGSGINITGASFQYFALYSGSQDARFFSGTNPTNYPFTIEFDVASINTIQSGVLPGYTTGQITLSGLPRLTGIPLNHGVYISDGTYWDYIECNPDGIRSYNHPELGIGINLYQPKRFRIGVSSQNIYILAENGRSVAGIGKFNTPVMTTYTGRSMLAFGAPPHSGYGSFSFPFSTSTTYSGINGIAGRSYWDNIKVLTGKLSIDNPTGLEKVYTTSTQSFYTAPFTPGINIAKWQRAVIIYDDYPGGTTTVYPQYLTSGQYTTITSLGVILSGASTASIDLTTVPIIGLHNYSSGQMMDSRSGIAYNSIRFKIDQASADGTNQAPIVDSIAVSTIKDYPILDQTPNWAIANKSTRVDFAVKQDLFYNTPPDIEPYSSFYFRAPLYTGAIVTGFLTDQSRNYNQIRIVGTGQINKYGPYNTAYQNYFYISGSALSGSDAAKYFGTDAIYNYAPDPYFNKPFKAVSSLTRYISNNLSGKLFGELGQDMYIPTGYTGEALMSLSKARIRRTYTEEQNNDDYAQKVVVQSRTSTTNCGVSILIPSGIRTSGASSVQVSLDLKINAGPAVLLTTEGLPIPNPIYCERYRFYDFQSVGFVVPTGLITNEFYLNVVADTGHTGVVEFLIDNVKVSPLVSSYLIATGVPTYEHFYGTTNTNSTGLLAKDFIGRASTVVGTDLYLDSYPTGVNTLVKKVRAGDSRGFNLYIDTYGYPIAVFDIVHRSWYDGYATGISGVITGGNLSVATGDKYIRSYTLTGLSRIPVGRWTHLGFIHQSWSHPNYSSRSVTGQHILGNHAACNRAFLAIDGVPVASVDTMELWKRYVSTGLCLTGFVDSTPFNTMVADGTGVLFIASGLQCKIDNLFVNRPPIADMESELSIKAAKAISPYFAPSVDIKPGHYQSSPEVSIPIYTVGRPAADVNATGRFFASSYAASIYNFDSPAGITNWDHGYLKNHLIYYGKGILRTEENPYGLSGLGSTKFVDGSFAEAKYSSSLERMMNDPDSMPKPEPDLSINYYTNLLYPVANSGDRLRGRLYAGGWFYAYNTGELFSIVDDVTSGTAYKALTISITGYSGIRFHRKKVDGSNAFTVDYTWTGSMLSGWRHIGIFYNWSGNDGATRRRNAMWFNGALVSGVGTTAGTDLGFLYNTGSATYFGHGAACNLRSWYMATDPYNYTEYSGYIVDHNRLYSSSGKGGVYTRLYINDQIYTGHTGISGSYNTPNFNSLTTIFSETGVMDASVWIGTNNYENEELPSAAGSALHTNMPFKFIEAYMFKYDDSALEQVFGAVDSPIRVGNVVPEHAINIARFDSPEYNSDASISTIDLASTNAGNLSAYRGGRFTVSKASYYKTGSSASGSYLNINASRYSGQRDLVFTRQVDTSNIQVTSMSATSKDFDRSSELFYAYLIGRGNYGVKISDYLDNVSGTIALSLTGNDAYRYLYNYHNLKQSINLTKTDGKPFEDLYWDIVYSPYTPAKLQDSVASGQSIAIDGIGAGSYRQPLTSGTYSVILLTSKIPDETVWVSYRGTSLSDHTFEIKKEIVNPIPIMRERVSNQQASAGQYYISRGIDNRTYNITIYGTYSGLSGVF